MVEKVTGSIGTEQTRQGLSEGYGVFKGKASRGITEREDTKSPHYTIIATDTKDPGKQYRVVVNVKSVVNPPDLRVLLDTDFQHPIVRQFLSLDFGFTAIAEANRKPGRIALDFIRGNLFDVRQMKVVPADQDGSNNDINDLIDFWVQRAIQSNKADIYAFGEPFKQGFGVHNIHMNQGNSGTFARENGVYQDGALFFHFGDRNSWIALFCAFQSQSFHTDDRTGDPLDRKGKVARSSADLILAEDEKQPEEIRIIAALVNPPGDDRGKEFVTLINTTSKPIDLQGWSLKDRLKRELLLKGLLQPGATINVQIPARGDRDFQLDNEGGILTLLNDRQLKVHGVSYTREEAAIPGRTLVF